jgi:hypothetical protein
MVWRLSLSLSLSGLFRFWIAEEGGILDPWTASRGRVVAPGVRLLDAKS